MSEPEAVMSDQTGNKTVRITLDSDEKAEVEYIVKLGLDAEIAAAKALAEAEERRRNKMLLRRLGLGSG